MSAALLELIDPRVIERARRLEVAMQLLRAGSTRREASGLIQARFGVTQQVAWRIVDRAFDMAGPITQKEGS